MKKKQQQKQQKQGQQSNIHAHLIRILLISLPHTSIRTALVPYE